MRKVILHYHLFKNAGTSVDEMLERSFPGRCVTREFPTSRADVNAHHLHLWLLTEPDATVFTSHTALLPPPSPAGVQCFPVIFVRHPIDRIASVYTFERAQNSDTFGSVLARNTALGGYLEVRLGMRYDRQCRNFHTWRLGHMFPVSEGTELSRSLAALEVLPFVGLVDAFDASLARMMKWLRPSFPDIQPHMVAANVSRDHSVSLGERLARIESEIGSNMYQQLVEANADDLALHTALSQRYAGA